MSDCLSIFSGVWRLVLVMPTMFALSGCADLDFDSTSETTGQTYAQYKVHMGDAWFDPKGASDISQRSSSTRDGYDAWWQFTASDADFKSIVTAVAKDESGPTEIEFNSNATLPSQWNAQSDVPVWWTIDGGSNPQAIHWCYKAGSAERHHGWFFAYNPDSKQVWCWHWNHQWSSNQCP